MCYATKKSFVWESRIIKTKENVVSKMMTYEKRWGQNVTEWNEVDYMKFFIVE